MPTKRGRGGGGGGTLGADSVSTRAIPKNIELTFQTTVRRKPENLKRESGPSKGQITEMAAAKETKPNMFKTTFKSECVPIRNKINLLEEDLLSITA